MGRKLIDNSDKNPLLSDRPLARLLLKLKINIDA
jgi:hypothetical protein